MASGGHLASRRSADARGESRKAGAMRAILRWNGILLAGGLWLLPVSALAQNATEPATANSPAPNTVGPHELQFLPWLIAALALAGGTLFFLWRRRPREALAGGPQFDLFAGPEPAPEPAPLPAPPPRAPAPPQPKPAAPAGTGIIAARLRPSLEIEMRPVRCVVEDSQVTIEFEIDLFNAGTAPARAVLAEATLLNASAAQGPELAAFFSSPAGIGQRMDAIAPMRRITISSQVAAPRSAIEEYELAGRKAFVPVIAFNALYEWSGGNAQTSAAYLVGRQTKSDKLGPLRLDMGARAFNGLAARPLPAGLRT